MVVSRVVGGTCGGSGAVVVWSGARRGRNAGAARGKRVAPEIEIILDVLILAPLPGSARFPPAVAYLSRLP